MIFCFDQYRPDFYSSIQRMETYILNFNSGVHQSTLPFCMREVWVITACLTLIDATASLYKDKLAAPDMEKEFYRVQGELFTLCRTKVTFFCV